MIKVIGNKFKRNFLWTPFMDEMKQTKVSAPKEFGRYQILEELGRGGMGAVYKAMDPQLQRLVALKTLIAQNQAAQEQVQRFLLEARATAKLHHPNIVRIHDIGTEQGVYYFTMDYIEGVSLAELSQQKQLSLSNIMALMEKIASAMHYAHKEGIIHRDLKPANIMIDNNREPCIMDFGLAKAINQDQHLTKTGTVMGTPSYMSPEQAEGKQKSIDPRSDIYTMGTILYELITGQVPFKGTSMVETLVKVVEQEPLAPRQLDPKIPKKLQTICLKAMAKKKKERYQSAAAFATDLTNFANSKKNPSAQKNKKHIAILAVAIVAIFVVLINIFSSNPPSKKTSQPKRTLPKNHKTSSSKPQSQKKLSLAQQQYQEYLSRLEKIKQAPVSLNTWRKEVILLKELCKFSKNVNRLPSRFNQDIENLTIVTAKHCALMLKHSLKKTSTSINIILEIWKKNILPPQLQKTFLDIYDSHWVKQSVYTKRRRSMARHAFNLWQWTAKNEASQKSFKKADPQQKEEMHRSLQEIYLEALPKVERFLQKRKFENGFEIAKKGVFPALLLLRLSHLVLPDKEKQAQEYWNLMSDKVYDLLAEQQEFVKKQDFKSIDAVSLRGVWVFMTKIILPLYPATNQNKIANLGDMEETIVDDYLYASAITDNLMDLTKKQTNVPAIHLQLCLWPTMQKTYKFLLSLYKKTASKQDYKRNFPGHNKSWYMRRASWEIGKIMRKYLLLVAEPSKWITTRNLARDCQKWNIAAHAWYKYAQRVTKRRVDSGRSKKNNRLGHYATYRNRIRKDYRNYELFKSYFEKIWYMH